MSLAAKDHAAADPLLRVTDLVKHFPVKSGLLSRTVERVHAVGLRRGHVVAARSVDQLLDR